MALNKKRTDAKNNADKALEKLAEETKRDNSAVKTVETLNAAFSNSTAETITDAVPVQSEASVPAVPVLSSVPDIHGNIDRGYGRNMDGTWRQSPAGRKAKEKSERKKQVALTLSAETIRALETWSSTKRKSATHYLSEYVEEHLDEIMQYFDHK